MPFRISGLVIQADGKILEAGSLDNGVPGMDVGIPVGGLLMVRFDTDGSLDTSFGQQGAVQVGTEDHPLGPYPLLPAPLQGEGANNT